jgi:hypothetical protein
METMPDLIQPGSLNNFVSKILWESSLYAMLSWFGTVILFSIRPCEALSERTFLSFRKRTSWRNSYSFEGNLRNHFEGYVQGLDGETGLGRRTPRSLLSIK